MVSDGSFGDDIDPAVSQGWSYTFTILDVYHYLIILLWLISFFGGSREMFLFTNWSMFHTKMRLASRSSSVMRSRKSRVCRSAFQSQSSKIFFSKGYPLTPKISLVFPLTVCHMVLVTLIDVRQSTVWFVRRSSRHQCDCWHQIFLMFEHFQSILNSLVFDPLQ